MQAENRILIVDDDRVSREMLSEVLRRAGYLPELAGSAEEALTRMQQRPAPVVLSDIRMLEMTGLELLRELKVVAPDSVVVLMTGFGSMEGALEAIREGAFDYLSKPFRMDELKAVIARAMKHRESLRLSAAVPRSPERQQQGLLGRSPQIVEVYKLMARAALSSSSVLVTGEPGTGKALITKTIHEKSAQKNAGYLVLTEEDLDSAGLDEKLRQARGAAVIVEDLSVLNASRQARLARALDLSQDEALDLRWMALSRKTFRDLTQSGGIREDLLYQLSVIVIEIPSLRERREDIPEMVAACLEKYNERNGKNVTQVSTRGMQVLQNYGWPGNVRELERVIERAVALSRTSVLEAEDFSELFAESAVPETSSAATFTSAVVNLEEVERRHIAQVLHQLSFNKSKAAEALGIDRATLYRKAKLYGIDLKGGKALHD